MKRTLLRTVGLGALYLFLAVVATYPLAFHAADHVFGLGTPPLNIWAMAWVNHQLPQNPWLLFDGNAFHPYSRSLAFSEHLFVPSLIAAPVIAATGNPVLAHNAVALLSLALAGLGMYLLCRELGADPISSFAAGLFYAFHTWNINELIRLQILSNQWFPFVILALIRFFRRPDVKSALFAGLTYTLQSLSCMYWALYLPLVTFPAVLFMKFRHSISWRKLFPLGASLGGALLLTAVFAVPYVRNSEAFGLQRDLPAAVPADRYLDVLPGNVLYAEALGTAKPNENAAHFLGFTVMALGVLGLLTKRVGPGDSGASYRALLTAFCVAGFLLSLGPEIYFGGWRISPGPYALFYHWVPGFESVRYPERFSLVLVLGLAPLVAFGLTRVRAMAGRGATLLLGAFLFVEHLSVPLTLSPIPTGPDIPQVYRWIAQQPDIQVIAEVPTTRYWGERSDAEPMYLSTVHWKRTVQGFTGYPPPAYNFIRWRLFHFPDEESIAFLEKLGVDAVVVHPKNDVASWNLEDDSRWSVEGPFPEGHITLRLLSSKGMQYDLSDDAGPALIEMDSSEWRVHGSTPGAARARDRDPQTSWSTAPNVQREHNFYAIRFPELTVPARVSMGLGAPYEFPMRFQIVGLGENGQWVDIPFDRVAAYDRYFAQLVHRPLEAKLEVDLIDAPAVREIRIRITETDPFEMPWTMTEVQVYKWAAGSSPGPGDF